LTQLLLDLKQEQRKMVKQILELRKEFLRIDDKFEEEIRHNRNKCSKRFQVCGCLKV